MSAQDQDMGGTDTAAAEEAPSGESLLPPPERVLATLDADGKRRWIRPRLSPGAFLTARRAVAYALMAIFVLLPHITIAGKPAILLNVVARQFTLFGTTFVPTDTPILLLFILGVVLSIFLLTALLGRVWCGWACPQTVYMEFLFRPLDRLFEGSPQEQAKLDREGGGFRRTAKNITFVLISCFLAHTFLAYFVGWSDLIGYMSRSPFAHPTAFLIVAGVTAAMSFDFIWFREQTCLVACPYGRFQSVLLDKDSLIVGYDVGRGEPRGKKKRKKKDLPVAAAAVAEAPQGDCIDCKACVITCPTGIDIRDGLQLECIGCAQCIDACDSIMEKVGLEKGLIRYGSRAELEEAAPKRVLRPRVLIYAVGLAAVLVVFTLLVVGRAPAKVTMLRGRGQRFATLPDGTINNLVRLKIRNQLDQESSFQLTLLEPQGAKLIMPSNPLVVEANGIEEADLFVVLPAAAYSGTGELLAKIRVDSGEGDSAFQREFQITIFGPK